MTVFRIFPLIFLLVVCQQAGANDPLPLRMGVLKFGTVNWELDVIKHHGLDKKHGIDLQIVPLGGKNATHVALQGGSADVIVSDWIWVTRQRARGRDYSFSPYSNAVGSLMVNSERNIHSLADLQDRRLGVAGGPLDKTWLLLRAYSRRTLGKDLAEIARPNFAAPPLLNKLALRGEMDAAINFWHYAARLKAAGFKALITLPDILDELGAQQRIPLIGWVFSEQWATSNNQAITGLLKASREAKRILLESDAEWNRLRGQMKADNDAIFIALRDGFREGIPQCFGDAETDAAAETFDILAQVGGAELAGRSERLSSGTFWPGFKWEPCEGS